jgi:hypothetical protein
VRSCRRRVEHRGRLDAGAESACALEERGSLDGVGRQHEELIDEELGRLVDAARRTSRSERDLRLRRASPDALPPALPSSFMRFGSVALVTVADKADGNVEN